MSSTVIRNVTLLCICGFLTIVSLYLYYVKHIDSHTYVVPSKTKDNPVISAMQGTVISADREISDCTQLFGEKSLAHNFSLSDVFYNNIDKFLSEVEANNARSIGHIYTLKFQFKLYHYLTSKLKFVRTVCETGMNDYLITVLTDVYVNVLSNQPTGCNPPGGRLPLLFAGPAVAFPAAQHHRPPFGLVGTHFTDPRGGYKAEWTWSLNRIKIHKT